MAAPHLASSLPLQVVFYLVWGNCMVAWAFWFAAVWGQAGAATLAATTSVVLTGLMANMIVAQVRLSVVYGVQPPRQHVTRLSIIQQYGLLSILYDCVLEDMLLTAPTMSACSYRTHLRTLYSAWVPLTRALIGVRCESPMPVTATRLFAPLVYKPLGGP